MHPQPEWGKSNNGDKRIRDEVTPKEVEEWLNVAFPQSTPPHWPREGVHLYNDGKPRELGAIVWRRMEYNERIPTFCRSQCAVLVKEKIPTGPDGRILPTYAEGRLEGHVSFPRTHTIDADSCAMGTVVRMLHNEVRMGLPTARPCKPRHQGVELDDPDDPIGWVSASDNWPCYATFESVDPPLPYPQGAEQWSERAFHWHGENEPWGIIFWWRSREGVYYYYLTPRRAAGVLSRKERSSDERSDRGLAKCMIDSFCMLDWTNDRPAAREGRNEWCRAVRRCVRDTCLHQGYDVPPYLAEDADQDGGYVDTLGPEYPYTQQEADEEWQNGTWAEKQQGLWPMRPDHQQRDPLGAFVRENPPPRGTRWPSSWADWSSGGNPPGAETAGGAAASAGEQPAEGGPVNWGGHFESERKAEAGKGKQGKVTT